MRSQPYSRTKKDILGLSIIRGGEIVTLSEHCANCLFPRKKLMTHITATQQLRIKRLFLMLRIIFTVSIYQPSVSKPLAWSMSHLLVLWL